MSTIAHPTERLCCRPVEDTTVHSMTCRAGRAPGCWMPVRGIYRHNAPTLAEARAEAEQAPYGLVSHRMSTVVSGARVKALADRYNRHVDARHLPVDAYAELGGVVGVLWREIDADADTVNYVTEIDDFEAKPADLFMLTVRELSELTQVCRGLSYELNDIERGAWTVW